MTATVKGDVHDIGKSIVGVVLGCNDYEVVDLGVMVPAARILETARELNADFIGLSGLITPSLDEMIHVASEMEREGFTIPLLIGGATTSRVHTAVKIAPAYSGPVVHVVDASRAVGVAGALVDPARRAGFVDEVAAEYETVRHDRSVRQAREHRLTLAEAQANHLPIDWSAGPPPPRPSYLGVRTFERFPLADLVDVIDWSPFFATWELRGAYPAILDDPRLGATARDLHGDALKLLRRIVDENLLRADAVVGFWPANADGDDIVLWTDEDRRTELARWHTLRQQMAKTDGRPNLALADFTAPVGSGVADYVGAFAVTDRPRGRRARRRVRGGPRRLRLDHGPGARRSPRRGVRGAPPRARPARAVGLFRRAPEQRRADRRALPGDPPRAGLPGLPGPHREADPVRAPRGRGAGGDPLTESYAMLPGSSVAGYYFWHPQSAYFGVGRIGRDQLENYARRSGKPLDEAERWLASNLADE